MKFNKENLDTITNIMKAYLSSDVATFVKASLFVQMDNMIREHVEDEDDFMLWLMDGIPDTMTIEEQYTQCYDLAECLKLEDVYKIIDLWERLLLNA